MVPAKNEISELSDSCLERCTDGALLHRWSEGCTDEGGLAETQRSISELRDTCCSLTELSNREFAEC